MMTIKLPRRLPLPVGFLVIILFATGCLAGPESDATSNRQANWLEDAHWGTMSHFLSDFLTRDQSGWSTGQTLTPDRVIPGPMTPAKWNEVIDGFDVEALADQLEEIGVDYHIFTVSQTSGYYIGPNAAYDSLLERDATTSRHSRRDLIAELGEALHERGIRLIVYIPHEPAIRGDTAAVERLRPTGQPHPETGQPLNEEQAWRVFAEHWEVILAEYANRWGDHVDGWWFDGCWFGQLAYEDAPNYDSLTNILLEANPEAVVSFNHQFRNLRGLPVPLEHFFAGETTSPHQHVITSPWHGDRGSIAQMLTYLGHTWYFSNEPRYSVEQIRIITRQLTHHGGIVTWDIPLTAQGRIVESFLPQLRAIGETARQDPLALWRERTGQRLVPEGNLAYRRPSYLVSRQESQGHHAYFPRLLPPNGSGDAARPAEYGVDGDPDTYAQASAEWSWRYLIDLQEQHTLGRVVVKFDPANYPTHVVLKVSTDGQDWQTVFEDRDHRGQGIDLALDNPADIRWLCIDSIKPDGEGQAGTQMAIGEVQVFASPATPTDEAP